ncbi:MAG: HlyD family efflux transporter periplasmic adaptor subunit [Flavobacterium sp.]|nr:HlyD family efflux transporter periplasmic adaptor subunit [Flavobacterium sp.]
MNKINIIFALLALLIFSCKEKNVEEIQLDTTVPVTLCSIDNSGLENYIDFNATATYLVKNIVKANATGYLSSVNVSVNDYVSTGQQLFSIITREAKILGNSVNKIDPSLNFGGAIRVKSNTNGIVTLINVQNGDYVQDGDQLVTINDAKSFGIVLSLPYDLKKFVKIGQALDILLPDETTRKAIVKDYMSTVDAASQTQNIVLKVSGKQDIPENLIVKVRINKSTSTKSISLPKLAVLSDETETHFWIMKMINSNTAVKVPIIKGIENDKKVEILEPILSVNDKILLTGNYGVSDTIKVKVIKN